MAEYSVRLVLDGAAVYVGSECIGTVRRVERDGTLLWQAVLLAVDGTENVVGERADTNEDAHELIMLIVKTHRANAAAERSSQKSNPAA